MLNSDMALKRYIGIYECRRCKRVSYSKETEVENYRGWIFELFPIYSSHICNDLDPDTQGLTELVGVREVPTKNGETKP